MAIPATQMRPGMIIKFKDDLHLVFSVEHRTPGNLRAFIQAKLRNIRTGAMYIERFRSPDPIDRVIVDEVKMEYLYNDGDDYYFMDQETYEQTAPQARHPRRRRRVPHAQPAHRRQLPRRQGRRHRAPHGRRDDRRRDRARHQVRHRQLRHQARQDRDRPRRPGPSLHQRGRKDPRRHRRRRLHVPRVVLGDLIRERRASARLSCFTFPTMRH